MSAGADTKTMAMNTSDNVKISPWQSLRVKITAATVCALILAMLVAMALGVAAIRNIGNKSAEQTLLLLCEAGQKNLDSYFKSVEQSVEMVSAYVESDLGGLEDAQLQAHLNRVSEIFRKMTFRTSGILTYYYRIDPTVSATQKGFWFVNTDDEGFREHEPTDITLYDTDDTSALVWFTVPKATGEGVWLPPYITDNLDVRVISYNVPVYLDKTFVGVIGIELDYKTMADQVNNITLYDNGYAFVNSADGTIVYHPRIDAMTNHPTVPEGLLGGERFFRYTFDGIEKQGVWLPLANGERLNVAVPVREINAGWQSWVRHIILVFTAMLVLFALGIMRFVGRITKPLRQLTECAEQVDAGNFDVHLDYREKDEVGVLANTFNNLTAHLKTHIGNLNDLAYADALTSLHNKGAFDIMLENLQAQVSKPGQSLAFAVCIFDCNNLKKINDQTGHDKGDIYLKETAAIICEVFEHSPVFRIGGDEFAAVLLNEDYQNREALLARFDELCAQKRVREAELWEQVDVARGMAVYDPKEDESVNDVVRRADKLMYDHKWKSKRHAS